MLAPYKCPSGDTSAPTVLFNKQGPSLAKPSCQTCFAYTQMYALALKRAERSSFAVMGTGPGDLRVEQFPTSSPDVTLAQVIQFFQNVKQSLNGIGIGSSGPIDLHPESQAFGHITSTPKTAWVNFDLVGTVRAALHLPVSFRPDVNAAILGEARWGAARGLSDAIYLTKWAGYRWRSTCSRTGGAWVSTPGNGTLRIPHDRVRDPFPGICPFHGDLFEGLAADRPLERAGMLLLLRFHLNIPHGLWRPSTSHMVSTISRSHSRPNVFCSAVA